MIKRVKHLIEYALLKLVALTVRPLSRPVAMKIGTLLGLLMMRILPRRLKIATNNMTAALPELSADEIVKNVRKNFITFGKNSIETMRLDLYSKDFADYEKYFHTEGLEYLKEAFALKKGLIFLSGHIGYFEAGAYSFPATGFGSMHFVAKHLKNPYVDAFTQKQRSSFGCQCLYSKRGARKIVKALKNNEVVGLLIDQHVNPKEGVIVDFFNRPAYATPVVAQIAMKTGTPVVPMAFYRTADDHYRIVCEPHFIIKPSTDPNYIQEQTQNMTNIIEKMIRVDVSQWYWLHRRWRV